MADITKKDQNALKMQVATAMSQTLSFSLERKYIKGLGDFDINPLFKIKEVSATPKSPVSWINISQVGRPLVDSSTEDCFTSIQKILHSCFLPQTAQLLFLITNDGIKNQMYLGIRPINRHINKRFMRQLSKFMMAQWPGLKCELLSDEEQVQLKEYAEQNFRTNGIENIYAFTGIPSMESQYKNLYPASIDRLMLGMNGCADFAYLVVADPIDASEVDAMLFKCREMGGQAESLKSFNISEGATAGISRSISNGTTWNHTDGTNSSVTGKDWSGAWNKIKGKASVGLIVGGVAVAACAAFPPATAAMGAIASGVSGATLVSAGNALMGLMDSKTTGESHSDSYGGSSSLTEGMSESQTETISHNVVNKHIEAVGEHLFYHSKRFESGKALGMWKVGAYLLTSDEKDALSGTMQLKAILSGQESIYEPIRVTNLTEADIEGFKIENSIAKLQSPNLYIQTLDNQNFDHPLGGRYKELKTVLTTKELSYLINFPLHSVPGISVVDSCPDFCLNAQVESKGIEFGKLVNGGTETKIPYTINPKVLSRHTLVCGINGSGKTNTIQAILNGIKNSVPYLVIEPAKTEYVDWAIEHNKKNPENPVAIYIPGCKKYRGAFVPEELHINPFDIIWLREDQEPNVLAHIDRLKSTFAAAFPMYDILPVLLEDLIYSVYQNKSTDWLNATPEFGKTKAPTLNSMRINVEKVIGAHQYEERIGRNMMACLNTRIDSLRRGWKGDMLCCNHSTTDKLFKRPVVVNLSYVGDDTDKAFIMALILQRLYEYRQAEAEIGAIDFNDSHCRHLTIIEEAHRVMAKCDNIEMPQYKSATMFSNMLSEVRAYGEGFMLVDQVPTRLIPDAIKNTNLKICHRMVAEDDCKAIGESMSLSKEQRRLIPRLLTGQCIVSSSYETNAYWVKATKVK